MGAFGSSTGGVDGIAVDPADGDVLVADPGNRRVQEFDSAGGFVRAWAVDGFSLESFALESRRERSRDYQNRGGQRRLRSASSLMLVVPLRETGRATLPNGVAGCQRWVVAAAVVVFEPYSEVGSRSATINFSIDTTGLVPVDYELQVAGVSGNFITIAFGTIAGSSQPVPVSHPLSGLRPGSEYSIRVVTSKPFNNPGFDYYQLHAVDGRSAGVVGERSRCRIR